MIFTFLFICSLIDDTSVFPFDHKNHIQCHTSSEVIKDNLDNNDEDDDDDGDDQDNYHNDYDDLEVTSLKT